MVDDKMTDMAEMATARANVYGLLATVFRAEPSSSFLERLKDPGVRGPLEALGLSLGENFHTLPEDRLREELTIEFTKLFLGPGGHISPHESLHTDRAHGGNADHWGPETVEVKRFMEAAGLAVDDRFPGMPDHISAEFEFMQKLCEFEAGAWQAGDKENAAYCQGVQKRFVDEHLARWVPTFCDKVTEKAKLPFYREMAAATKVFLDFDGDCMANS